MEFRDYLGLDALPHALALRIVDAPKDHTLSQWLLSLPERAADAERGRRLAIELARWFAAGDDPVIADPLAESLTFAQTTTRAFETAFWRTIVTLAHGRFLTKDNADCFQDEATRQALRARKRRGKLKRDLDALADYLLRYHARQIARAGLDGKACRR
jgi:hypothetical protein